MPAKLAAATVLAVGILSAAAWCVREDTLGAYTTSLAGRSGNQRRNITLAAGALDGAVVPAHEIFSFNARVGGCTPEKGYLPAPAIMEGAAAESTGGGICQVSSTLYNAALLAGMQIVERHAHTSPASSVPPGRDAAVAAGSADLAFRNNTPDRVVIRARAGNGRLAVTITGRRRAGPDARITVNTRSGRGRCTATVWRETGASRELVSMDTYRL